MALTIREDESEAGGYAFIDLGRPLAVESVRLSFRRQDSEPRFLGLEGWQPEAAWLPADLVPGRGPNAVVRVGPTVVDWIDELVPVEISAEGVGSLGVVVWPHLTRSPRRLTELRLGARAPRNEQPPPAPVRPPRPEPAPQPIAVPVAPAAEPAAQAKMEPAKAPEPAKKKSKLRVALIAAAVVAAVVLVSAPFALARLGYYELVIEAVGPRDDHARRASRRLGAMVRGLVAQGPAAGRAGGEGRLAHCARGEFRRQRCTLRDRAGTARLPGRPGARANNRIDAQPGLGSDDRADRFHLASRGRKAAGHVDGPDLLQRPERRPNAARSEE